jgi:hypothetical protein
MTPKIKRITNAAHIVLVLAVLVSAFVALSASASASVNIQIANATAQPSSTATTQITIDGMTNFGAATVTLSYDPGVVQITDVTAGDVGTPTPNINNTAGTATIAAYVSTATGPDSPIVFANLELTAIGSSGETSPLTLGITTLADANGTSVNATAQSGVFVVNGTVDTVTRELPDNASAGASITVNLTVDVETGARYYVIDEIVPTGWTVSATSGGAYTSETGHVKWIVIGGAADTVYSYTVLVPANASGTYTFDGVYRFEGMTAEATILGDTTVNVSVSPPTLVTYTITNTTITPPQTTSIDVRFSEQVSAIIKIEDASGNLVNELYTSSGVTNPDPKTWDGTYTNGTTVPDDIYTVNVSGVSTTTGLSVVDTSKTITVGAAPVPATVSIGSATGSVGDTVNVSINITGALKIGAMDISVTYDPSILNGTNVANGSMMGSLPDLLVACNLIPGVINISFVTYPDAINGDGELFVVTFDVVGGDDSESSVLDIEAEAYTTDVPPQYVYVDTADGSFVVSSSAVSTVSFDPLDSTTYMGSTTTPRYQIRA